RRRVAVGVAGVIAIVVIGGAVVWVVRSASDESTSTTTTSASDTRRGVVTIRTVTVGDPGNASVGSDRQCPEAGHPLAEGRACGKDRLVARRLADRLLQPGVRRRPRHLLERLHRAA